MENLESALPWTIVVMAKAPVPGKVKTRMIPALTLEQAAELHQAMLMCLLDRVDKCIFHNHINHKILCYDQLSAAGLESPDIRSKEILGEIRRTVGLPTGWHVIEQGTGDLGQRMERVWNQMVCGPFIFLGADSPDIPMKWLSDVVSPDNMRDRQNSGTVYLGPVDDGGYWTMGATRQMLTLIKGIDWGSSKVYHQTYEAASAIGANIVELERWFDVDDIVDLQQLRERLKQALEPALITLRTRLDEICI